MFVSYCVALKQETPTNTSTCHYWWLHDALSIFSARTCFRPQTADDVSYRAHSASVAPLELGYDERSAQAATTTTTTIIPIRTIIKIIKYSYNYGGQAAVGVTSISQIGRELAHVPVSSLLVRRMSRR